MVPSGVAVVAVCRDHVLRLGHRIPPASAPPGRQGCGSRCGRAVGTCCKLAPSAPLQTAARPYK
eukprot:scaffold3319_cov427-Prasinococcus_capsulatus_cf.AAC.7